jgi:tetratricopeptide (TPR) repeat protein
MPPGTGILVALLMLALGPSSILSTAQAQDEAADETLEAPSAPTSDDRARALFGEGRTAYEEGRYDDAILLWEEAWRLSMKHPLLFNLANAYERSGRLELALEQLMRYRPYALPDELGQIESRIVNLTARVEEAEVEAEQAAVEEAEREAELTAERERVEQLLQLQAAANEETPPPVGGYVLMGLGAAAITTGGVFTVMANVQRTRLNELCVAQDAGALCPAEALEPRAKHRVDRTVAFLGYGVGVVALAGGTAVVISRSGSGTSIVGVRGAF